MVLWFISDRIITDRFTSFASDASAAFQKANELYQKQEYDTAAKIYEQLISAAMPLRSLL